MRIPNPKAVTTTEAYLAYKAEVLEQSELKDKLYHPYLHIDGWLAYWTELTATYPTDKNGDPECLTDEEAYIAYLSGVTSEYPEALKDPADVRVASYLRYLISARFGRPDYPVTREEFYLSMMKPRFIPSGDPSSEIELDGTVEAPFVDLKMYGDTFQQTYSGKNLFSGNFAQFDSTGGSGSIYSYFELPSEDNYVITLIAKNDIPVQSSSKYLGFTKQGGSASGGYKWVFNIESTATKGQHLTLTNTYQGAYLNYLSIYHGDATTLKWFTDNFDIQLEKNSSSTDYEPYVGGTASPNPDYPQDIEVVTGRQVVGVRSNNLFDRKNAFENNILVWTTGNDYAEEGSLVGGYIDVNEGDNFISNYSMFIFFYDSSSTYLGTLHGDGTIKKASPAAEYNPKSFTVPSGYSIAKMRIEYRKNRGGNPDDMVAINDIILNSGTTLLPYSPYGADYEINLGKNIIDFSTVNYSGANGGNGTRIGGTYTVDGGSDNWGGVAFAQDDIQLEPNTTYTFSATVQSTTNPNGSAVFANRFINTTGAYILGNYAQAGERSVVTFTTPDSVPSTGDLRLLPRVSNATAVFTDIQLEKGSTATPYATYFEPIELCKIGDYQDYIYKDEGDWYVHKETGKVVLDGTETWDGGGSSSGSPDCIYVYTTVVDDEIGATGVQVDAKNSHFINAGKLLSNATTDNISEFSIGSASSTSRLRFLVRKEIATSKATFETWLGSNNTAVYYALATPTDNQITDENLLAQLDALKEGGSYNDKTYIKVSATDPNLPGLLYVEAAV